MSNKIDYSKYTLFTENKYKLSLHMIERAYWCSKIIPMMFHGDFKSPKTHELEERVGEFIDLSSAIDGTNKITTSLIKDHVTKAVADFGKGGKGFFNGLVDKDLEIYEVIPDIYDVVKKDKKDPKSKRVEHVMTKDLCAHYLIWTYKKGDWKVDLDGNEKPIGISQGKYIFETLMPELLQTTWVTHEHNVALAKELSRIKKECSSSGVLDIDQFYQRLVIDGEHYKNVGIRFHQLRHFQLKGNVYPELKTDWLKELQTKKITKVKKRKTVELWM